jgi:NAD(P)-dependent dehydrogenase (short-subunit alcohol dehydrogenase family)
MELANSTVLLLGGAGLVGQAVAREILPHRPARIVVTSLFRKDAMEAAELLARSPGAEGIAMEPRWGDLFVQEAVRDRPRGEVLGDPTARRQMVDDLYGELTEEVFQRSSLGVLLLDVRPQVIVDCINTAGALAYQNAFASATDLLAKADAGGADRDAVERHLATLYLPQLIRHVQISLEGMRRAGTRIYVKVGTAGTGGMGLNIPFTHAEERPSRVLLAKSGLAGAHTLLLYLMARTPGAPSVKEVKPTAAISWKSIGYGPIHRGGRTFLRSDAVHPLPLSEAFQDGADAAWRESDAPLEGVYLDAGENGLFSLAEFETLTALGLMEFITPEEIATGVVREIMAHPTGKDVVAALDSATMGPTYRAGVLRSTALQRMEAMEAEHGVRAVAYEMLGPPRLAKLLFEGELLRRLFGTREAAAALDPAETARRTHALVEEDADLRQRMLSVGLPILLPDGESLLRGARVDVPPAPDVPVGDARLVERGWVDLRASNWSRWARRMGAFEAELAARPGVEEGSAGDHDFGDDSPGIRPGRLAAWIFRTEDQGERIKR